ncbi:MAG: CYTH domain-containing protein [Eubacteriales bacterium]|nr:CYTH domain-containing protein [Eubacteriales bacterium]
MEREFKWNIPTPADFSRIADSALVAPLMQSSGDIQMQAVYFDTADKQIARVRGGLRLRRENSESIVCLKLSAQESFDGACKAREEYECAAPDIRTGIRNLPSVGAPQAFCDTLFKSNLLEIGRMEFTRHAYQLAYRSCTCELALDSGKMLRCGRAAPICEMELELKSGSEADFDALALELQNTFSLQPQPLSKLARMMQL